jgi:hypothetical protein
MFENEHPDFYKEYHDLREDHYYKHVKETNVQETGFQELLPDENELVEANTKSKAKKPKKDKLETN